MHKHNFGQTLKLQRGGYPEYKVKVRAVEIRCPTCPTRSHFIQDKQKISIYLSLDKYNV